MSKNYSWWQQRRDRRTQQRIASDVWHKYHGTSQQRSKKTNSLLLKVEIVLFLIFLLSVATIILLLANG